MPRPTYVRYALGALWCASATACAAWAQPGAIASSPAAAPPAARVLLLRNGGVLTGTVTQAADRYVVVSGGGQIELPSAKVAAAVPTIEDAYDYRRQALDRPTVDAHLALADWCLRYNLLPQAARELLDARGLEPRHPRLALLERRLAAAANMARESAEVTQASYDEAADEDAPAAKPEFRPIDDLSHVAIERFTRKVQPVLVNNCTVAGCHQPGGAQAFQLDRALLRNLSNRRTTKRNLSATWALVDREEPHLSPLLTVPRRTHGGMNAPIFGPRHHAAFMHLVEWVALVAPAVEPRPDPPASSFENSPAAAADHLAAVTKSAAHAGPAAPVGEAPESVLDAPAQVRFGAQLRAWQPKDPFDPEIFNRQSRRRDESLPGAGPTLTPKTYSD